MSMDVTKIDFNQVFADAVAAYDRISPFLVGGAFEASLGEPLIRATQTPKPSIPSAEDFMRAKQAGQFGPRTGFSAFEMHVFGLALKESLMATMKTENAVRGLDVQMVFSRAAHTIFDRAASQEVHATRQAAIGLVSIGALKSAPHNWM